MSLPCSNTRLNIGGCATYCTYKHLVAGWLAWGGANHGCTTLLQHVFDYVTGQLSAFEDDTVYPWLNQLTGGSGYTSVPTVSITGGGGSGATATCTIQDGVVDTITLMNPGNNYSTPPTVNFIGGGGSGATAYVDMGAVPGAGFASCTAGGGTGLGCGIYNLSMLASGYYIAVFATDASTSPSYVGTGLGYWPNSAAIAGLGGLGSEIQVNYSDIPTDMVPATGGVSAFATLVNPAGYVYDGNTVDNICKYATLPACGPDGATNYPQPYYLPPPPLSRCLDDVGDEYVFLYSNGAGTGAYCDAAGGNTIPEGTVAPPCASYPDDPFDGYP